MLEGNLPCGENPVIYALRETNTHVFFFLPESMLDCLCQHGSEV